MCIILFQLILIHFCVCIESTLGNNVMRNRLWLKLWQRGYVCHRAQVSKRKWKRWQQKFVASLQCSRQDVVVITTEVSVQIMHTCSECDNKNKDLMQIIAQLIRAKKYKISLFTEVHWRANCAVGQNFNVIKTNIYITLFYMCVIFLIFGQL